MGKAREFQKNIYFCFIDYANMAINKYIYITMYEGASIVPSECVVNTL